MGEESQEEKYNPGSTNTSDRANIAGPVDTKGGDFIGRDQNIYGDLVIGDKHEHHHHHHPPEKKPLPPPRMALKPPDDFVQRPQEYEQLITYLLAEDKQTVAITATLRGAGGFGKTTLAQAICHDERILDTFPDGILWTTIGDDRNKVIPGLQKLYQALTGEEAQFVDEHDATVQLSAELDERRCLMVIDDVWNGVHLKPFLQGGGQCARLITTRIASVVPKETELVAVDAMRQTEAVDLLGAGLDAPDTAQLAALAGRLGEWPLLLKLVNRRLYEDVQRHDVSLPEAIAAVNEELDEFGLTSFDADNAEERDQAVAASMSISLRQLRTDAKYGRIQVDEGARFRELAIFPEDAVIPVSTVALLWGETGQFSTKAIERLCRRLADLSLLLVYDQQNQTIQLHDVTRHYLIEQATLKQYQTWQEHLLNSYETKCGGKWNRLPDDGYVYQNLLWHMREAGQQDKLEQLLFRYDWLDAKLQAMDVLSLINDFDLRRDTERFTPGELLQHALQMSANVLVWDKNQMASQLYGRLLGLGETWQTFISEIQRQGRVHWLQPYAPNLTPPGGNFIYTLSGHTAGVDNLLLTRDGRLISSSSSRGRDRDHTVRVWDVEMGELLHTLEGEGHNTTGVSNLLLTDDGRLLSSYSGWGSAPVKVWDIETGELLHTLEGHTDPVDNLLLTGDGRLLSSCNSSDHTVKIWDIETGILLHSLEGHTDGVNNLLLTGDGRLLSSCRNIFNSRSSDHTVKVWDIETGILLHSLEGHTAGVDNLLLTGNGRLLSSCGRYSSDHTVKVWDIETGILLCSLEGHTAPVDNLLLTGDGCLLSSCNSRQDIDHTVKVWDIETGILLHSLEGHTDGVNNLLLTGDGRLISSCGGEYSSDDYTVKVWDIETGILLHSLEGHTDGVNNLHLTGDGRLISSCGGKYSSDYTVKVWEIETGALLCSLEGHTAGVDNLLLTGNGRLLSSCGSWGSDHTVKAWHIRTGILLQSLEGHTAGVDNLLLTRDGRLISSCGREDSYDYTVKVWDIETGIVLHSLEGHINGVDNLLLTNDGRLISSCGREYNCYDHTVKVWDIETGILLHSLEGYTNPHTRYTNGVSNLLLTGDGRLISSSSGKYSSGDTVKVWDIETGALLCSLKGHTAGVDNLLLTGNGRLLSSCGGKFIFSNDHTVKVWDIETGRLLHTLKGHTGPVSNLLLTGNGRLLSSCGSYRVDHMVKVWDIETGRLLHTLEGHTGPVSNLLLTGDGRLLSSCYSSDHTVKVWDIETGILLHSLEGHTAGVDNLLLTGDGRLLSSCGDFMSNDHTVKVWDFELGGLLHSLEGHTAPVDKLLLTGHGRLISSCNHESVDEFGDDHDDHTVKVWDIETGGLLHSLEDHSSSISFMALLPMSGYLMSLGEMQLIIWQLDEGKQVASFTADAPIESYAITPDDTIILGDGLGWVHFLKLVGPR